MDRLRSALAAPFILALASCNVPAEAPTGPRVAAPVERTTLKIASWNLEHLAEADGAGCRRRSGADYAALRAYAEALDADVVAFQEVESRQAAERVFDPRRYAIIISGRPGSGRSGACRDKPGQMIRRQAVGFAIRRGVPFKHHPDVQALGLGDPDLRWGVDVTVGTGAPIRLLGVHLKSGCNLGRSVEDRDRGILFDQLPVLEQWIDARAREGVAFAVLGDLNRRIARPNDAFFAELDDDDPAGADLVFAAGDRGAGCKARYREFIDHIVLGAIAARRAVAGSFDEFAYGVTEERHPSDHCPVSVKLHLPRSD